MQLFVSGYGASPTNTAAWYSPEGNPLVENPSPSPHAAVSDISLENPSWAIIQGDRLILAGETTPHSMLYLYSLSMTLLDKVTIPGGLLCHMSLTPDGNAVCGACYDTGEVFSIDLLPTAWGPMRSFQRQVVDSMAVTRAHCIVPDPVHNFMYSANIALDRIFRYRWTPEGLIEEDNLPLPSGEGPRHILPDATGEYLHVITEYSNRLWTIETSPSGMKATASVSILPDGFSGTSYGSTLCRSSDGRFLYAANRGADAIALFSVESGGLLRLVSHFSCEGQWPRHIAISPDNACLAVANQNNHEVVLLSLNPSTGLPTGRKTCIAFASPAFVQFLADKPNDG